jgi:hypothetical protein
MKGPMDRAACRGDNGILSRRSWLWGRFPPVALYSRLTSGPHLASISARNSPRSFVTHSSSFTPELLWSHMSDRACRIKSQSSVPALGIRNVDQHLACCLNRVARPMQFRQRDFDLRSEYGHQPRLHLQGPIEEVVMTATLTLNAIAKGRETIAHRADAKAAHIAPAVRELQAAGVMSLAGIAAGLNDQGIPTPRGGEWQAVQVLRVLNRL